MFLTSAAAGSAFLHDDPRLCGRACHPAMLLEDQRRGGDDPICQRHHTGHFADGMLRYFPVEIREHMSRKNDVAVPSRYADFVVSDLPPKNADAPGLPVRRRSAAAPREARSGRSSPEAKIASQTTPFPSLFQVSFLDVGETLAGRRCALQCTPVWRAPPKRPVTSYLGLVRQLGRARSLVIARVGCLLDLEFRRSNSRAPYRGSGSVSRR